MYQDSAIRVATNNGRIPKTTGTVAILLTLLQSEIGPTFTQAYAGKVLADLGAVEALPTLRRLAWFSSKAAIRAAAWTAIRRITRERQSQ